MIGLAGRNFKLKMLVSAQYKFAAGCRTLSFSVTNEEVDNTDKLSNGIKESVSFGIQNISISCEGVMKDGLAINEMKELSTSNQFKEFQIVSDSGETISGDFQVSSFERKGQHNDAEMYSFTLTSTGGVTVA